MDDAGPEQEEPGLDAIPDFIDNNASASTTARYAAAQATAAATAPLVGSEHLSAAQIVQEYYGNKAEHRPANKTIERFDQLLMAFLSFRETEIAQKLTQIVKAGERAAVDFQKIDDRFADLTKRLEAVDAAIARPEKALDGFRATVTEELKLQGARKLWTDSATTAQRAYAISWAILVILLVCVPVVAIANYVAITDFFHAISVSIFNDIPSGSSDTVALISAISRLFVVTIPIALFLWLIKLVVRFNMRSLLLMDDARQRNTMLETYLHLVERDTAVKADRPLILEALFRRTPGHGADTIEPPNLADILKMGNVGK